MTHHHMVQGTQYGKEKLMGARLEEVGCLKLKQTRKLWVQANVAGLPSY